MSYLLYYSTNRIEIQNLYKQSLGSPELAGGACLLQSSSFDATKLQGTTPLSAWNNITNFFYMDLEPNLIQFPLSF